MSKQVAVIAEGSKTEKKYWNSMCRLFFHEDPAVFIMLPTSGNLYMLWKQLTEDGNYTDILEIVRERTKVGKEALSGKTRDDFAEIYLFFDYDPHQNNLGEKDEAPEVVLQKMTDTFNNETEQGKLYISYPMCEALRDIKDMSCIPFTDCYLSAEQIGKYKDKTGKPNKYSNIGDFTIETWEMMIWIFLKRCMCLFDIEYEPSTAIKWFKKNITPRIIFDKEQTLFNTKEQVFVLSAFPEFLLDYYPAERFAIDEKSKIGDHGCIYKQN